MNKKDRFTFGYIVFYLAVECLTLNVYTQIGLND